jgi:hypothetical protein
MKAAWIDKDTILIPQFVDRRATAVRVSSVLKTSNRFRSMILSTDCSNEISCC